MTVTSEADSLVPRRGLAILLPDHHQLIEARCRDLLRAAHADSKRDLVATWRAVEHELVEHITAEEEVILPPYALHSPMDAERIRTDHARIRALLLAIGVDIELHHARLANLEVLCDVLAAHARHEDELMYAWAADALPAHLLQGLRDRIDQVIARRH